MRSRDVALMIGLFSTALWGFEVPEEEKFSTAEGTVSGAVWLATVDLNGGRESDIVVLVDESGNGTTPDGHVDRTFRLQAEGGALPRLNLHLSDAVVTWDRDAVTAVTAEGEVYTFALEGTEAADAIVGQGLVHTRSTQLALAGASALSAAQLEDVVDVLSQRQPTICHAGGAGAISCSVDGCSVECEPPSHACCQDNSWETDCCGCLF